MEKRKENKTKGTLPGLLLLTEVSDERHSQKTIKGNWICDSCLQSRSMSVSTVCGVRYRRQKQVLTSWNRGDSAEMTWRRRKIELGREGENKELTFN